jgi:hypothetical protein
MMQDALVYLAAAVLCVPLAKRLGLGSILAYLLAGVAIGPWGLRLVEDVESILHFSEFGVVLMLFVIGLELGRNASEPRRGVRRRRYKRAVRSGARRSRVGFPCRRRSSRDLPLRFRRRLHAMQTWATQPRPPHGRNALSCFFRTSPRSPAGGNSVALAHGHGRHSRLQALKAAAAVAAVLVIGI